MAEKTANTRKPFEGKIPDETREHYRAAREEFRKSMEGFFPPEFRPKAMVNLDIRKEDKGKEKVFDTKGNLHRFFDQWIVKRVAEKYDWLPVPFLYDIEIGPSYGEMKEMHRG